MELGPSILKNNYDCYLYVDDNREKHKHSKELWKIFLKDPDWTSRCEQIWIWDENIQDGIKIH